MNQLSMVEAALQVKFISEAGSTPGAASPLIIYDTDWLALYIDSALSRWVAERREQLEEGNLMIWVMLAGKASVAELYK